MLALDNLWPTEKNAAYIYFHASSKLAWGQVFPKEEKNHNVLSRVLGKRLRFIANVNEPYFVLIFASSQARIFGVQHFT